MLDYYIKIGISVYLLLGATFVLTNFILDDEFLECKEVSSNLVEVIGWVLLDIFIFPVFTFIFNNNPSSLFELDENNKLKHREFLSVWLNLILICTIYVLLKMYVL